MSDNYLKDANPWVARRDGLKQVAYKRPDNFDEMVENFNKTSLVAVKRKSPIRPKDLAAARRRVTNKIKKGLLPTPTPTPAPTSQTCSQSQAPTS